MTEKESPNRTDRRPRLADLASRLLLPLRFRGKNRLLDLLLPRTGKFSARRFGCEVEFDIRDLIQRQFFLGTYEPQETAVFRSRLGPGMTFCDVGANVGWYSLQAARRVGPAGRILAFEPGPYAFTRLAKTISANQLKQVTLVQAGLSDHSGHLDLFEPREFGNYTPTLVPNSGGNPVRVKVLRLDDWLEENRVGAIDLMKIDVEGHEHRVLSGAERALAAGRVRAVLCEFNGTWLTRSGSSPQDLDAFLQKLGFKEARRRRRTPEEMARPETRIFLHQSPPTAAADSGLTRPDTRQ